MNCVTCPAVHDCLSISGYDRFRSACPLAVLGGTTLARWTVLSDCSATSLTSCSRYYAEASAVFLRPCKVSRCGLRTELERLSAY